MECDAEEKYNLSLKKPTDFIELVSCKYVGIFCPEIIDSSMHIVEGCLRNICYGA